MLFYQSYAPSLRFSRLIARYMIIIDDEKHNDWQKMDVVPNGLPGLGFSFGENFRYLTASEPHKEISCGNIIGIHNRSYTSNWKNPMHLFVIVFKPLGLYHLLKRDMGELKNDLTNFNMLGLKDSEWICESLHNLPVHEDKIAFMESWLEQKLGGRSLNPTLIEHIADTIIERKGLISVGALSKELHINKKYIERNFSLQLGLSPKEFAGIIRFNYLNTLMQEGTVSWKELTYLGNFYDQSHLIKHFQKVTGLSPGAFKEMTDLRPEATFLKKHNIYELISPA